MKTKQVFILIIVSLALSVGINLWHVRDNVPFCLDSPACNLNMEPKGTITKHYYGYPVNYKAKEIFEPINKDEKKPNYAGFASAETDLQRFNLVNIIINVVFWFALLKLITNLLPIKVVSSKQESLSLR